MAFLNGTDPSLRQIRTPTVDTFTAGAQFTAGSSTQVSLSADPGTENNVIITFDGITQHRDTYAVSGTTVTFDAAIATGVSKVEATYTTTIPAHEPADGSVTVGKLSTTGSPSASTFLNGSMAWATPSGGKVAQVVQAETNSIINTTNSISNDTSIPQISEGAEALTCAITPTNASSTLFIFVDMVLGSGGGGVGSIIALFKDSTANALQSKVVQTGQVNVVHADAKFIHKIAAGSTSAQTFKLRFAASGGGTVGINSYDGSTASMGGTMKTSLIIMEVSP